MSNDRKNYARFLRVHCALIANLAEVIRMARPESNDDPEDWVQDADYHQDLDNALDALREELANSSVHFDPPEKYRLNDLDSDVAACYGDSQVRRPSGYGYRYYAYHLPPRTGTPNEPGWSFLDEDNSVAILWSDAPIPYDGHRTSRGRRWHQVAQAKSDGQGWYDAALKRIIRIAEASEQEEFYVWEEAEGTFAVWQWEEIGFDQYRAAEFNHAMLDGRYGRYWHYNDLNLGEVRNRVGFKGD